MFNKAAKREALIERIEAMLETDELKASKELLKTKKQDAIASLNSLVTSANEVKATTNAVIDKLNVVPEVNLDQCEGVIFVNYKGVILHANSAALEILERTPSNLINQQIEHVLTGKRNVKKNVLHCSNTVIDVLKSTPADAKSSLKCKRQITALISGSNEVRLDEPVCVIFKQGHIEQRLTVSLSLLDTAARELEDVTYVCRISRHVTA